MAANANIHFTITIRTVRIMNAFDRMAEYAKLAAHDALELCADETVNLARVKVWAKQHPAGTPTPSIAPEPPAKVSGDLGRSIMKADVHDDGLHKWSIQAGPTNPPIYVRAQEMGRPGGQWPNTRLPKRPYLKPTVDELLHIGVYQDAFKHFWGEAVRSAL